MCRIIRSIRMVDGSSFIASLPVPSSCLPAFLASFLHSMKIKIKSWHSVGVWKWNIDSELCSICRQSFDSTCPDCLYPGDDCPPVFGKCNHAFHIHCILKWLKNAQQGKEQCRRDKYSIRLLQISQQCNISNMVNCL
jgi:anaphase-promoting complex subunit 11